MTKAVYNYYLPDITEQVDVGIVGSKVQKDGSCAAVNPVVSPQVVNDIITGNFVQAKVSQVATSAIGAHLAGDEWSLDNQRAGIREST